MLAGNPPSRPRNGQCAESDPAQTQVLRPRSRDQTSIGSTGRSSRGIRWQHERRQVRQQGRRPRSVAPHTTKSDAAKDICRRPGRGERGGAGSPWSPGHAAFRRQRKSRLQHGSHTCSSSRSREGQPPLRRRSSWHAMRGDSLILAPGSKSIEMAEETLINQVWSDRCEFNLQGTQRDRTN